MPFKSDKQRRFLFKFKPEVAKQFVEESKRRVRTGNPRREAKEKMDRDMPATERAKQMANRIRKRIRSKR